MAAFPLAAQITVCHVNLPKVIEFMPETGRARLGLQEYARFQELQLQLDLEIMTQRLLNRARKFPSDGGRTESAILVRAWALRDSAFLEVASMKTAMLDLIHVRLQEAIDTVARQHGAVIVLHVGRGSNCFQQELDPFLQAYKLASSSWAWALSDSVVIPTPLLSMPTSDVVFASESALDLTEEVIAWLQRREE